MANLQFLRGSHASLKQLTSTKIKDGAFYLTEDTHRLYVGQSTGENTAQLIDLNKYILDVDSVANLPSKTDVQAGDFYYCIKENVLARYQKIKDEPVTYGWVQINPDTSIQNVSLNSLDSTINNTVSTVINITETRTHEANDNTPAGGKDEFGVRQTFKGENISVRTNNPITNKSEAEINPKSANGTITFIGDTYDLSTVAVDHIKDEEKAITAYNTSIDLDLNRNIAIDNKTGESITKKEKVRFTGEKGISITSKEKTTPTSENDPAISEITIQGTVNEQLSNRITDFDTNGSIMGIELSIQDSRIGVDNTKATAFVPTVTYGKINENKTNEENTKPSRSTLAKVQEGKNYTDARPTYNFDLNVYTIDEIDSILDAHTRTADAMRYIKAIDSIDKLPDGSSDKPVQIGDTYKMSNQDPIIEEDENGSVIRIIKAGDLFIATGDNKEGPNGDIDPSQNEGGKIIWDWVPAGNDTYKGYTTIDQEEVSNPNGTKTTINHMNLAMVNGENTDEKVSVLGVRATDKLHVIHSTENAGSDTLIYTIKHDKQEVPDANPVKNGEREEQDQTSFDRDGNRDNNGAIQLVLPTLDTDDDGNLKCDKYGHITGYKTQVINLTHNHLKEVATRAENPKKKDAQGNEISDSIDSKRAITYIKTTMEDVNDTKETYFELNTNHTNIEFSTASNEDTKTSSTTINLVWGSF